MIYSLKITLAGNLNTIKNITQSILPSTINRCNCASPPCGPDLTLLIANHDLIN
jgi:hypothetical protein